MERASLFKQKIIYVKTSGHHFSANVKISSDLEISILNKILINKELQRFATNSGHKIYYHNAPVHWMKVFNFIPDYYIDGVKTYSSHLKSIQFRNKSHANAVILALHSSMFYWFNFLYTNCRDLSKSNILNFKLNIDDIKNCSNGEIDKLVNILMEDLKKNSKIYSRVSKGKKSQFDSFYPMKSKSIIDRIDSILSIEYNFTQEELDFIINYDLKYRMGDELEADE